MNFVFYLSRISMSLVKPVIPQYCMCEHNSVISLLGQTEKSWLFIYLFTTGMGNHWNTFKKEQEYKQNKDQKAQHKIPHLNRIFHQKNNKS